MKGHHKQFRNELRSGRSSRGGRSKDGVKISEMSKYAAQRSRIRTDGVKISGEK
jgi:hypothetical protein